MEKFVSKNGLVPVTFKIRCANYNVGDTAGFDSEQSDLLVKKGIAVYHNPSKATAAAESKKGK